MIGGNEEAISMKTVMRKSDLNASQSNIRTPSHGFLGELGRKKSLNTYSRSAMRMLDAGIGNIMEAAIAASKPVAWRAETNGRAAARPEATPGRHF
jgi:hypothetical protein